MKPGLLVLLALLPCIAGAAGKSLYGVNTLAINWPDFCRAIKPVPLDNGHGQCPLSHPGDIFHKGGRYMGKPLCAAVEKRYRFFVTPAGVTRCKSSMTFSLIRRGRDAERSTGLYQQPFVEWRNKHFRVPSP